MERSGRVPHGDADRAGSEARNEQMSERTKAAR